MNIRQPMKTAAGFFVSQMTLGKASQDRPILAGRMGLRCDGFFLSGQVYWHYAVKRGGETVTVYIDLVILMNFLVDFFLLIGTNRLCGYPPGWKKAVLAAAVGSVYAGACVLPGFHFLGNLLWRTVSLALMSWIAFGFSLGALRRGIVFVLLSMALGGVAMGLNGNGAWNVLAAAGVLCGMCVLGFRERIGKASYVPVELSYGDKRIHLTALCDTGNTLRDPVTGRPVLIVGADVAHKLTGLSVQQLKSPVLTMTQSPISGLRLIPYRAIGTDGGLLLALRMQDVSIGNWKGSSLVAFAPDGLCREGDYQALTGGAA